MWGEDIQARSFKFSVAIVEVCRKLDKSGTARVLGTQLLRSGTSVGANIEEAQGGQSRADFIAKMSVAHKEIRETEYWLRLLESVKELSPETAAPLVLESEEIRKVVSSIILTAKPGSRQEHKRREHSATLPASQS
jgi:four helix bundle protein